MNGPDDVYVERKGRVKRVGQRRHGNRRWTRRRDGLLGLAATAALAIALCGRKRDPCCYYIQSTVPGLADLRLRLDKRVPRPGLGVVERLDMRPIRSRDLKPAVNEIRDAGAVR